MNRILQTAHTLRIARENLHYVSNERGDHNAVQQARSELSAALEAHSQAVRNTHPAPGMAVAGLVLR